MVSPKCIPNYSMYYFTRRYYMQVLFGDQYIYVTNTIK